MKDLDPAYLGIELDDRDPVAVFEDLAAAMEKALPTWSLANGSVEAVLMESVALAVADLIYAVNRVPTAVLGGILGLYGVPRSEGTPATGTVCIEFDTATSTTIPAGLRFVIPDTDTILVTTSVVDVDEQTAADLPVATETPGAAGVSLSGTALDLLDSIPGAAAATLAADLTGGTDPEDDAAWLDRASAVLARVTSSLVVAEHFTAWCLQDVRVARALTLDLYNPTSGNDPGEDPGHVTVATYGRGGQVDPNVRAELTDQMLERSAAMLAIHTIEATVTPVDVEVNVVARPGFDSDDLRARIVAALTAWLNPAAWDWNEPVRPTEITALVANVPGVDYVDEVVSPDTPLSIDGVAGLATAGALTVTLL